MFPQCSAIGICAAIDTRNYPDTKPADFANPKANCAKVTLLQPAWDLGMDWCPTDPATWNRLPRGKTRYIHSTPATYIDEQSNYFELFMGENDPLRAWLVNPDGTWQYIARGEEVASAKATGMHGGMSGGFLSLTSNEGKNGIAWASIPDLDANRQLSTGHMSAYDLRGLLQLRGTGICSGREHGRRALDCNVTAEHCSLRRECLSSLWHGAWATNKYRLRCYSDVSGDLWIRSDVGLLRIRKQSIKPERLIAKTLVALAHGDETRFRVPLLCYAQAPLRHGFSSQTVSEN